MDQIDKIQERMAAMTRTLDSMKLALDAMMKKEDTLEEIEAKEMLSKKQKIIEDYFNDIDNYNHGMNLLPESFSQ